ncbi:MAG: hypothetical protein QHH19_00320 [Candidatus Thermoplasmatota archaeon]|jgi:ABC-type microcin C transport system permease subunit YejB|nr:hypothetical protein [Candidatus Thermoplasmatota archaeon]
MFEKPETLNILKKMIVIAALALLIIPIFDLIVAEAELSTDANSVLLLIKNPLVYFIALLLWFQIITFLLSIYWEKDDLSKGITTSSFLVIIGYTIQQINTSVLLPINKPIASAHTLISNIGLLILLFGFINIFYNIMKYLWVKI